MPESRDVRGMHLPNYKYYYVEEMLATVPPTGVVTLLDISLGDQENGNWYATLRNGAPERLLHIRAYVPDWQELDPQEWGEHIVGRLEQVESWLPGEQPRTWNLWRDPFVCVSVANEPNLEPRLDISVANYVRYARWHSEVWDEIDAQVPGRKALSCWGALAYGHEPPGYPPDGEYQIPEVRAAIQRCDIAAVHDYGHLDWSDGTKTVPGGRDALWHMLRSHRPAGFDGPHDPGGVLAQFPDKVWLITESGTWTHFDITRTQETLQAMEMALAMDAASNRILGRTWFIWNSGKEHQANLIAPNTTLRVELMNLPPMPTAARVPVRGQDPQPLPPPGPAEVAYRRYQLQPGDTLWWIAARELGSGRRWPELLRMVPVGDVRDLPVGAIIMIPQE